MRRYYLVILALLLLNTVQAHAQFWGCPPVIADHPYSAIWVDTITRAPSADAYPESRMPIGRDSTGSIRCGNPQPGREPSPTEIVDAVRGQDILLDCALHHGQRVEGKLVDQCGPKVNVRPYNNKPQHWDDAFIERRLQTMASAPPKTRTDGGMTIERHSLGLRTIDGIQCAGWIETRQGTNAQGQPEDHSHEEWDSIVYGVMEVSGVDRINKSQSHIVLEDFHREEPDAKLFEVPQEYEAAYAVAMSSSTPLAH